MSSRRFHQRKMQRRDFRCKECGMVSPALKQRVKTHVGHEKSMWCCRCRKITKHEQVCE